MHRSVSSDDVKEYSTGARVKDIQLEKEEDIEYQSGHLFHSSGVTSVKLARSRQKMRNGHAILPEGPLNDQVLSTNGSYSLDLVRCSQIPSAKRGRRSERTPMTKGTLKSIIKEGKLHILHVYVYSYRAGSRIAKGEGHKCGSAAEVGVESVYHTHFRHGDHANKLIIYNCIWFLRLQYSYSDCKYRRSGIFRVKNISCEKF